MTQTQCCIVGGGPAGAILALLLARQGVDVTLLEAHGTFDRDFRGDTVHPATLELLDQLGLIDRLLEIPHGMRRSFPMYTPTGVVPFLGGGHLPTKYPYTVQLPQARFLELVISEAQRYATFHLKLSARVHALIVEDGVVRGVSYRSNGVAGNVSAAVTVGTDGRFSSVRQLAGFTPIATSQAMDVLWFRLPRRPVDPPHPDGIYVGNHQYAVVFNLGDQWQIGYIFAKGTYERVRAAGIDALRQSLSNLVPWLSDNTAHLQHWGQLSMLSVESSYLRRWYRPGLLLIGDAAHVMSPVAGVGINVAIQDAVVAANILGPRLRAGAAVREGDLRTIQRRRYWQMRLIQRLQGTIQRQILTEVEGSSPSGIMPQLMRLPPVRDFRSRLIAFGGLRPERVHPTTHSAVALVASAGLTVLGASGNRAANEAVLPDTAGR